MSTTHQRDLSPKTKEETLDVLSQIGTYYLDHPLSFLSHFISIFHLRLDEFMSHPWNTHDKGWVLMGTLAALLESLKPKQQYLSKPCTFQSNSINAKYMLYPKEAGDLVFVKISTDPNADKLECDAVVLRALMKHLETRNKAAFPELWMSSRMFVQWRMSGGGIPVMKHFVEFDKMLVDLGHGYGPQIPPKTIDVPCLYTQAIVPGISLADVLDMFALGIRVAMKDKKNVPGAAYIQDAGNKMAVVLRSNLLTRLYEKAGEAGDSSVQYMKRHAKTVADAIGQRVFMRLAHTWTALLNMGERVHFVHGDLHLGNILYDMYADAWTVIDFGRSYVNIDKAFAKEPKRETVLIESMKIQSDGPRVTLKPEDFWMTTHFGSPYLRNPSGSKVPELAIMNDIGGMCAILWWGLFEVVETCWKSQKVAETFHDAFIDVPFLSKDGDHFVVAKHMTPYIPLMSTMENEHTPVLFTLLPGLLYFSILVKVLAYHGWVSAPKRVQLNGIEMLLVPVDELFGDDAPFFAGGQLLPEVYKDIVNVMDTEIRACHFETHLAKWVEKVTAQVGGRLVKQTRVPPVITKHSTPVRKMDTWMRPYDVRRTGGATVEALHAVEKIYKTVAKYNMDKRLSIVSRGTRVLTKKVQGSRRR